MLKELCDALDIQCELKMYGFFELTHGTAPA